jgi:hypothetical protein
MKIEIKELIRPAREELVLVRFSFDNEIGKMQVEALNRKYNDAGELIGSEPIRLLFRGERFIKARDFSVPPETSEKILQMVLRKLEIDRKYSDGSLCDALPEGVPPYPALPQEF